MPNVSRSIIRTLRRLVLPLVLLLAFVLPPVVVILGNGMSGSMLTFGMLGSQLALGQAHAAQQTSGERLQLFAGKPARG